jgi:hypothetical protein
MPPGAPTLDVLYAHRTAEFGTVLKHQLENLPSGTLPLYQGTSQGGYVDDSDISVTILEIREDEHRIQARAGVFFTEIIVGCSCGDDPMPVNAYCELLIQLDKTTAEAKFEVIQA